MEFRFVIFIISEYKVFQSDLSKISNNKVYEDYVYRVSKHVSGLGDKLDGLVPMWISPDTGKFAKTGTTITLGARTDR